jgi:hypothetical protein
MHRDNASVAARDHDIAPLEETSLMAESPRQMTRRQCLMSAAAGGISGSHTPSLPPSLSAAWRPLDRRLIPAGRSLSAVGSTLVNAAGQEVRLTGINWFGMEISAFAPHGLWEREWKDMRDQIAATGDASEDQWMQDWVALAQRYLGNSTILGADLYHEPHNPATWSDGTVATDWRRTTRS